MKKRWLFVTLLVGGLALGITGGIVVAHGGGTGSDSPLESFASRVAAILGLEEAQVQDAFNQAARETQDEGLQRKLDRQVDQGRLTQEQADEYMEWYQSRPEALSPGSPFRGFGRHGFHRGWHGMGFWNGVPPTPAPETSGETSL